MESNQMKKKVPISDPGKLKAHRVSSPTFAQGKIYSE
jgi:hypothetical protein